MRWKRELTRGILAVALVLAGASSTRAELLPYQATLSIDIFGQSVSLSGTVSPPPTGTTTTPTFPTTTFPTTPTTTFTTQSLGAGLLASASLASFSIAGGTIAGTTTLLVTDPFASPLTAVRLAAANGAGTFMGPGNGGSGLMPLQGNVFLCLFGPATNTNPCGAIATVTIPLGTPGAGVGVGGTITNAPTGPVDVLVTVVGAPWTLGTAVAHGSASTQTAMGFVHGPASNTSTAGLPGGVVSYVTPIQLETNITSGLARIPAFATFTLAFEPTPSPTPPPDPKVTVCHGKGNGGGTTNRVSVSSLQAHLKHGDTLGACPP